jgi:hypothetical protein
MRWRKHRVVRTVDIMIPDFLLDEILPLVLLATTGSGLQ